MTLITSLPRTRAFLAGGALILALAACGSSTPSRSSSSSRSHNAPTTPVTPSHATTTGGTGGASPSSPAGIAAQNKVMRCLRAHGIKAQHNLLAGAETNGTGPQASGGQLAAAEHACSRQIRQAFNVLHGRTPGG
jgi:hypothetical protein